MKTLQRICTWLCIACVILAVPLVLMLIWGTDSKLRIGMYLNTIGVFFFAGAIVLSVLKMVLPASEDAR